MAKRDKEEAADTGADATEAPAGCRHVVAVQPIGEDKARAFCIRCGEVGQAVKRTGIQRDTIKASLPLRRPDTDSK